MTILVTAASGHLGRLVVHALLGRGVPATDLVATARDTADITDLADLGVETRRADYDDRASLDAAFAGVDRLLLVSGSVPGGRVAQHATAIAAAVDAGVGHVVYTSAPQAGTASYGLAQEHRATEQDLRDSGLTWTVLRNGWYVENYTENLGPALEHGVMLGAAGEGRFSPVTRADLAEATAVVLTTDGHEGEVLELAGETLSMSELAAVVGEASGREVRYVDLPAAELETQLQAAGLPQPVAQMLADSDLGISRDELQGDSAPLARLLGRDPTPVADAVRAALA